MDNSLSSRTARFVSINQILIRGTEICSLTWLIFWWSDIRVINIIEIGSNKKCWNILNWSLRDFEKKLRIFFFNENRHCNCKIGNTCKMIWYQYTYKPPIPNATLWNVLQILFSLEKTNDIIQINVWYWPIWYIQPRLCGDL